MAAWAPLGTRCSPTLLRQAPGPRGAELLGVFLVILVVQSIDECILHLFWTQLPGLAELSCLLWHSV